MSQKATNMAAPVPGAAPSYLKNHHDGVLIVISAARFS